VVSAVISACALASWHDRITTRRSRQWYGCPATSAVTGSHRSKPSAISVEVPPGCTWWIRVKACSSVHTGARELAKSAGGTWISDNGHT
jgi:hypothetical protein